ncbi:hypothetical protein [Sphingomonas sp.]|uniref:hypothetical protein n=1 Tax=Sphingomonas sp. TaxID=28214 RepID=UPI002EDA4399
MNGMFKGPLVIDRDQSVTGMIAGDVIVKSGVRASISAMVSGDVVVEPGGQAVVSGMIAGRVIGDGHGRQPQRLG